MANGLHNTPAFGAPPIPPGSRIIPVSAPPSAETMARLEKDREIQIRTLSLQLAIEIAKNEEWYLARVLANAKCFTAFILDEPLNQ